MPETPPPGFEKVDDCDLCEAARITPWFHEDDVCWIAECEICYVPMVVWRSHGVEPPPDALSHMHEALARVAAEAVPQRLPVVLDVVRLDQLVHVTPPPPWCNGDVRKI